MENFQMELEKSKELPYVDRIDIEEVFADQIRFVQFDGYSVRIEFAVTRPHVTGQNQAESTLYPAARLVLSPVAAVTLQSQLSELVSALEKQGLLKRLGPSSAMTQ